MTYLTTPLQHAQASHCSELAFMHAALVQAPLRDAEQSKKESIPLLGTEASSGAPNTSGVKNATLRYDLPTPAVAVRNLVSTSI